MSKPVGGPHHYPIEFAQALALQKQRPKATADIDEATRLGTSVSGIVVEYWQESRERDLPQEREKEKRYEKFEELSKEFLGEVPASKEELEIEANVQKADRVFVNALASVLHLPEDQRNWEGIKAYYQRRNDWVIQHFGKILPSSLPEDVYERAAALEKIIRADRFRLFHNALHNAIERADSLSFAILLSLGAEVNLYTVLLAFEKYQVGQDKQFMTKLLEERGDEVNKIASTYLSDILARSHKLSVDSLRQAVVFFRFLIEKKGFRPTAHQIQYSAVIAKNKTNPLDVKEAAIREIARVLSSVPPG